jgi:RHS repeat-associated protein
VDQVLADEQVTNVSTPGNVLWPLPDNQGSVRDLVDNDGDVVNHLVYGAFGQTLSETNAAVDHLFGYVGRETDEESDLQFFRNRYYDPANGRFISEDPLGFAAGDENLNRCVSKVSSNGNCWPRMIARRMRAPACYRSGASATPEFAS